jgi:hypothetical protein
MATTSHKVIAAASTIGVAETALAMTHMGGIGVIVGLAVGAVAYCSVDDIERATGRKLPALPARSGAPTPGTTNEMSLGYRLLHGKSTREAQQPDGEQALQQIERKLAQQTQVKQSIDDDVTEKVPVVGQAVPSSTVTPVFPIYPDDETLHLGTVIETNQRFDPSIDKLLGYGAIFAGSQGSGKSNTVGIIAEHAGKCYMSEIIFDMKSEYYTILDVVPNGMRVGPSESSAKMGNRFYALTLTRPEKGWTEEQKQQAIDDLTNDTAQFASDVMEQGYQAVFDIPAYLENGYDWNDIARIVTGIINGLMKWSIARTNANDRLPCLVSFDEAHIFFPQQVEMKQLFNQEVLSKLNVATFNIVNMGRSYGYTMIFSTQRIANIAKWTIGNSQIKVIMRHSVDVDLERCVEEIGKGYIDTKGVSTLKQGTGFVLGFTSDPMLVKFDKRQSRHDSNTPDIKRAHARHRDHQPAIGQTTTVVTPQMQRREAPTVATPQMSPLPPKSTGGKLTLDLIIDLANSGRIDTNTMLKMMERLPIVDADDERYTDPEIEVQENITSLPDRLRMVVGQNVYEEPEEEDTSIVLGKNTNGGKVQLTQEQFQLAVRLRKSGMSTGYRDLMEPFGLSEHHAKVLNARIRQELGLDA